MQLGNIVNEFHKIYNDEKYIINVICIYDIYGTARNSQHGTLPRSQIYGCRIHHQNNVQL